MPSQNLRLTFYGDDFTGSTDAMEALARAGLRTVLFIEPPTPEQLAPFKGIVALGVAGMSRAMSPQQMDAELPAVFEQIKNLGAPIVHYKTCSTFDSAPQIGSIGHAIDIAQSILHSPFVPLVVGAPVLGRYCIFGNLFARSGPETEPYRLDRHPTMSRHPVTPMDESDLRRHLAKQTKKSIGLIDILTFTAGHERATERLNTLLKSGDEIVLFDTLHEDNLPTIGRLIDEASRERQPLFVAGSSGVEYALTAHWKAEGNLPAPPSWTGAGQVDQIVAVSGSCSPVTDRQIAWAIQNGFTEIALQTERLTNESQIEHVVHQAQDILRKGDSVIIHTSRGPDDPRIHSTAALFIGNHVGRILLAILESTDIKRIAVAGGDTSGHVARQLKIEALEMIAPMAPGSPLCRVYAANPAINGREIVFKGGQIGRQDFFGSVRRGIQ